VDENDIIREDGEEYARKAMQAGVEVTEVRALAIVGRIPGYFCRRWGSIDVARPRRAPCYDANIKLVPKGSGSCSI
jgi:hypothetical protein